MGLEYCGFEIRQDTFTSMPVFRRAKAEPWQQLSDARMVEMRKYLMEERHFGKISRELMSDAILYAADQNAFDSMRDYLERTLPEWDGVDRITDFFRKYCGAKSTPYEWATGSLHVDGALRPRDHGARYQGGHRSGPRRQAGRAQVYARPSARP